jgi:hypothetical protein
MLLKYISLDEADQTKSDAYARMPNHTHMYQEMRANKIQMYSSLLLKTKVLMHARPHQH